MYEYETITILKPDLAPGRAEKVSEKIQKILTEGKAELVETKDWGRRKLAYPIEKFTYGQYLYSNYYGSGQFITDLERILKFDEDVLRYMTVKVGLSSVAKKRDPAKKISQLEEANSGSFDAPYDDRDY